MDTSYKYGSMDQVAMGAGGLSKLKMYGSQNCLL